MRDASRRQHQRNREQGPERALASPLLRGLLELGLMLALFVGFGVGWRSAFAEPPRGNRDGAYAGAMAEAARRHPLWLIDGYNVLCTGLLGGREREGWWRAERRAELLAALESLDEPEAEVWVVFDGERPAETETAAASARVRSIFAPSADTWLTDAVRARAPEGPTTVVTADRQLAGRARHRGAQVVSPRELLRRCT